jgi:hypothetical protein
MAAGNGSIRRDRWPRPSPGAGFGDEEGDVIADIADIFLRQERLRADETGRRFLQRISAAAEPAALQIGAGQHARITWPARVSIEDDPPGVASAQSRVRHRSPARRRHSAPPGQQPKPSRPTLSIACTAIACSDHFQSRQPVRCATLIPCGFR